MNQSSPLPKFLGALYLCLLCFGCAQTQPTRHGLPNFGIIMPPMNGQPGIYRGGQPGPEGNTWLSSHGVIRQIELNKGTDDAATRCSFEIVRIPISTAEQIFGFGLEKKIRRAAALMIPGTYIHCEYGKNRTGTVAGYYRITHGWTKPAALLEMNHYGWGDSLPGLKWFWRNARTAP